MLKHANDARAYHVDASRVYKQQQCLGVYVRMPELLPYFFLTKLLNIGHSTSHIRQSSTYARIKPTSTLADLACAPSSRLRLRVGYHNGV